MIDRVEKRIFGLFVLALSVLVVVAATAVSNMHRAIATSDWVNHTHAVILEADGIVSALHAAEAALRNYLFTGDARDQNEYRQAYDALAEHLEVAKALTRQEGPQLAKFRQLEPLITKRTDFARAAVQARQTNALEGARAALASDDGGATLSEIRRLVEKLKSEENLLLQARDKASYLQAQTTRWTVFVGVAINFLLLALVAWLIRDDLAARRHAAAALQEANALLEARVAERTAELANANQALTEENLERRWANQALEHQLRYNQLIVDSISDLVFVITKTLNITRVNPAAIQQTGLGAPELIGRALSQVLRPAAHALPGAVAEPDPVALSLKAGRQLHDQPGWLVRKAGQDAAVHFSLYPLHDQDKVVGGVVTVRVAPPPAPGLDQPRQPLAPSRPSP